MNDITDSEFFDEELSGADANNENAARVLKAFKEVMQAEEDNETLAAQLEHNNSIISKHKTATLPDLLKEMGTEIWRDPETGIAVELEMSVNSSLPKDVTKRNAILDALRPIGIEQIMAEEFSVTFSPNDKRAIAIREILGLAQPPVIEDSVDGLSDVQGFRLSNEQINMIHDLRKSLELSDLPAEEKLGVHASRLKAWLKEMINKGNGTIISEAGIWFGKHAKFVKPKVKK